MFHRSGDLVFFFVSARPPLERNPTRENFSPKNIHTLYVSNLLHACVSNCAICHPESFNLPFDGLFSSRGNHLGPIMVRMTVNRRFAVASLFSRLLRNRICMKNSTESDFGLKQ